jgi:hypothetical protein
MTVYVDDVKIIWRQNLWCHLVADSLEELHSFALMLGLKREWFQDSASYPHYDVTVHNRDRALKLGAQLGNRAHIIGCAKILKQELAKRNLTLTLVQQSLF